MTAGPAMATAGPVAAPGRPVRAWTAAYDIRLALPLGAFFLVFFLAPLALLLLVSFYADPGMTRFGLDQYARFLLDPFSLRVLGATLWLGVEVTALTLLLGLPLALLLTWAPDHRPRLLFDRAFEAAWQVDRVGQDTHRGWWPLRYRSNG